MISRDKWLAFLLVSGSLLSTAKGLRLYGVFGPGKAILVLFVATSLTHPFQNIANPAKRAYGRALAIFWYVLFTALVAGYLLRSGMVEYQVIPRSLAAYALSSAVLYAFYRSGLAANGAETVLKYLAVGTLAVAALVFLVSTLGLGNIGGVELYWGAGATRFQGWSTDPNQFAIMFAAVPFLFIYLSVGVWWDTRPVKAIAWSAVALLSFAVVQVRTVSDSLLVGWVCGVLYLLLRWFMRSKFTTKFLLILTGAFVVLIPSVFESMGRVVPLLVSFGERDSQEATRIRIWRDSLKIIVESPVFGLGPDVGPVSLSGRVLDAHNNILHLGMSAGLVGMMSYILLGGYALWLTVVFGRPLLGAAVVSLFVFGLLHTTVRHPVFWVSLVVSALLACSEQLSSDAGRRRELGASR